MNYFQLEAKVVSRGAGRSVIAAAAYASCSRLYNDYDGLTHDYTRKHGCLYSEVFLPQYAPEEWKDRQLLWEAVESVEKTKDSRLARELVVRFSRRTILRYDLDFIPHNISTFQMIQIQGLTGIASDQ